MTGRHIPRNINAFLFREFLLMNLTMLARKQINNTKIHTRKVNIATGGTRFILPQMYGKIPNGKRIIHNSGSIMR
jgi:hypothetical protein